MSLLNFDSINYTFPRLEDKDKSFKDLSLTLKTGEITAILGESGEGKSTLAKILLGIIKASSPYEIRENFVKLPKIKFGYAPQENPFRDDFRIKKIFDYYSLIQLPHRLTYYRESKIQDILVKMKLEDKKDLLFKDLSGGEKKRVNIGVALLFEETDYFILDEPFNELDVSTSNKLSSDLWEIAHHEDKSFLIINHNIENLKGFDRLLFLSKGNFKFDGSPNEMLYKFGISEQEVKNYNKVNFSDVYTFYQNSEEI